MTLGFPQAIKLILQKLGPVTETEAQLPWILVGETLKNMVKSTALYIYKEHFGIFFECLQVQELIAVVLSLESPSSAGDYIL